MKIREIILGVLILFNTNFILSQDTIKGNQPFKIIEGKITHLDTPLPNVNISIINLEIGTTSDNNGNYTINAKVGDIIEYSYVGFNTVSIIIEDVTSTLNIEMSEKIIKLEETVVTARKKIGKIQSASNKLSKEINTGVGKIIPGLLGNKVYYLTGKDILPHYTSLRTALQREISGFVPNNFDIDGAVYIGYEPFINFSTIKDLYVIKGPGTSKWGPGNGVIIIKTKDSPEEIAKRRKAKAEQYRNQNYYDNDATVIAKNSKVSTPKTNTAITNTEIIKEIKGKVTYLDAPLPSVNIIIVGKSTGTNTNTKGEYTIKAAVGDIVQYSHLGFATVSVIIEDVTKILDIEMVLEENELDEVIVETDGSVGKTLELDKKSNEDFSTSRGNMDPKRTGYAMSFLDGEDISSMYLTLGEAIAGKIPGVRYDQLTKKVIVKPRSSINTPSYPIWDVDGNIFQDEPPMDLNNIKSVRILKTLAGTNRYGSDGAGGVIVVQSKNKDYNPIEEQRKKVTEQYTNKNYYSNDATLVNSENLNTNSFTKALEAFNSKQKAFIYYDEKLKSQIKEYSDHISIALKFASHFNDKNLAKEVLLKLSRTHNKNPEILKAIAYHFQAYGFKKETIKIYESIFKLRPKYAQSYRDLANAYVENDQYKKAWRLYMSYLLQGNDLSGEGIGQLFYKEMEWMYFNRRNQTDIKQKFQPLSENLADFRDDVRLVFEWNTSEAEFDIEFVNPELRSYVFEHSLASNQELIMDEKTKGYSSNSYFIDDLREGEWLINLVYKGNKKPEPTYFKLTCYYNWGKANQEKVVTVYRLYQQRDKMQLLSLNKSLLIATN